MLRIDEELLRRTFETMAEDCEIVIESPSFVEMRDIRGKFIKRVHDGLWEAHITVYIGNDQTDFTVKDSSFKGLQERAFKRYETLKATVFEF